MPRFFNLGILFGYVCVQCVFAQAQDPIEAKVSKLKVSTGEVFVYSIKIRGTFAAPKLRPPEFKDFILVSTSQSRNYSFQAGAAQMDLTINYGLVAPKPGLFTLGKAVLEDRQKEYSSQPFQIEVVGQPLQERRRVPPSIDTGTQI